MSVVFGERPNRKGILTLPENARPLLKRRLRSQAASHRRVEKKIKNRGKDVRRKKDLFPEVWSYRGVNSGDILTSRSNGSFTLDHFVQDNQGKTHFAVLNSYTDAGHPRQITILAERIDYKHKRIMDRLSGYTHGVDSVPAHLASGLLSGLPMILMLLLSPVPQTKDHIHTFLGMSEANHTLHVYDAASYGSLER